MRAIACGGTDCDDTNSARYPGNVEVCDPGHVDEDCDPVTFGPRDADGDGRASNACCNVGSDGGLRCGDDCDDSNGNVHVGATEACDAIDNDCDAAIDEGVLVALWPDVDGDLFGDAMATPVQGCADSVAHTASNGDDCDDGDATMHPGAAEICDEAMRDEDCDAMNNEGCACPVVGTTRPCCHGRGTDICTTTDGGAAWAGCSVAPADEFCNGVDDDCDGVIDNATPGRSLCAIDRQTCTSMGCACGTNEVVCGSSCVNLTAPCDNGIAGACHQTGHLACSTGAMSCVLDPPAWPGDLFYNGDDGRMLHAFGVSDTCSDGDCTDTHGWRTQDHAGYLQYGPYVDLPPGSYEAVFSFWCNHSIVGQTTPYRVVVDVTTDHGATVLGSMPFETTEWLSTDVHIPFGRSTCMTGVELRMNITAPSVCDIISTRVRRIS